MGRRGLAVAATALVTTLQFPPCGVDGARSSSLFVSAGTEGSQGDGFEPSVPLATASLILAEEKGLQADPAQAGAAA